MPITVSSTLNCARMPAAERLDEPLPSFAFSSTVTRKPCSAKRTAVNALVEPPPIRTTCSPVRRVDGMVFTTYCCLSGRNELGPYMLTLCHRLSDSYKHVN